MSDEMISINDRGFLLGDGIFDTSMVLNSRMMFRDRHLKRLMDAAEALDIAVETNDVETAIDRAIEGVEAGRLRVSVSRPFDGSPGAPIRTQVTSLDATRQFQPVRAITSDIARLPGAPSAQYKTLSYIDNVEALRRALTKGADTALMLNAFGRPASGAMENLFILEDTKLVTPPTEEGVLAGTLRAWVLDEASEAGLTVEEATLSVERLASADAVFLTNSLRLIAPVWSLDDNTLLTKWPSALVDLAHHLLHAIKGQCEMRTPFGRPRYNDPLPGETAI